ncbi:MAG: putative ABC transporter permease [Clostridia bacterium]
MPTFSHVSLMFFAYCFIGWACECIYCSFPARRFINRGFLAGPVCPVYGVGALAVLILLRPVSENPVATFFLGMVVTSVLEYATGVILERVFHMKWWDYSNRRFNLHGRVCLLNSMLFGLMSVALVMIIHPFILSILRNMSNLLATVFASRLSALFLVDIWFSVSGAIDLHGKFAELSATIEARTHEISSKFSHRRLLGAFPHLKSTRYNEAAERLRSLIREARLKRKNSK